MLIPRRLSHASISTHAEDFSDGVGWASFATCSLRPAMIYNPNSGVGGGPPEFWRTWQGATMALQPVDAVNVTLWSHTISPSQTLVSVYEDPAVTSQGRRLSHNSNLRLITSRLVSVNQTGVRLSLGLPSREPAFVQLLASDFTFAEVFYEIDFYLNGTSEADLVSPCLHPGNDSLTQGCDPRMPACRVLAALSTRS